MEKGYLPVAPEDQYGFYMPMLRCGVETTGLGLRKDTIEACKEMHYGNCDNRVTRHTYVMKSNYRCIECGAERKWGN